MGITDESGLPVGDELLELYERLGRDLKDEAAMERLRRIVAELGCRLAMTGLLHWDKVEFGGRAGAPYGGIVSAVHEFGELEGDESPMREVSELRMRLDEAFLQLERLVGERAMAELMAPVARDPRPGHEVYQHERPEPEAYLEIGTKGGRGTRERYEHLTRTEPDQN
jgi:hypothetical protein